MPFLYIKFCPMFYLIAGICANVLIFLAFRTFSIFKIDNLQAIVVNYFVCVITGIIFIGKPDILLSIDLTATWTWFAMFIGLMLVIGFYSASITAQTMGVSITSVASKMSMVFPVLFSLFFMKIESKDFSFFNYLGMFLAILAIYLGSLREGAIKKSDLSKLWMFLWPFTVFVAGGLIDISINYSNYKLINQQNEEVFAIALFGGAAIIGSVLLLFQKRKLELKSLAGGLYLGIPNYFSLFLVLKALTAFDNNGAVFYPIYNVGIIMLSSFLAMILFREKLSKLNFLGLGISVLALFLLSHQEIIDYF
jgi:drug/metabolite transporter (DMT)-like permease